MPAGSPGLGQRLVAQPQGEGALREGQGGATYRTVPSVGTCLSVLAWGHGREGPRGEGLRVLQSEVTGLGCNAETWALVPALCGTGRRSHKKQLLLGLNYKLWGLEWVISMFLTTPSALKNGQTSPQRHPTVIT